LNAALNFGFYTHPEPFEKHFSTPVSSVVEPDPDADLPIRNYFLYEAEPDPALL
jgi:hypothetical protein